MSTDSDRLQINDALRSYCRGVDRLDAAAVMAAFHPDAMLLDYGPEPSSVTTFVERVLPALERRFTATQHRISNVAIEFDGAKAQVETYVLAYHVQPASSEHSGDTEQLLTFNGRYIDRFEQRGGPWLIASRSLRVDWSRVEPIESTMGGAWIPSGRAGSPDPLYD